MRRAIAATLAALLTLSCTDVSGPSDPAAGTYRLVSVEYETPRLRQWCSAPCDSGYRMTFEGGEAIGNGQLLEVQSSFMGGEAELVPAYMLEVGYYEVDGDTLLLEAYGSRGLVGWMRGPYKRDGDRLIREQTITASGVVQAQLKAIWERT